MDSKCDECFVRSAEVFFHQVWIHCLWDHSYMTHPQRVVVVVVRHYEMEVGRESKI